MPCPDPPWLDGALADRAAHLSPSDRAGALALARELTGVERGLGHGGAWDHLATLATLGSVDLTVARTVEPHLDALAILHQAGPLDLSPVGADASSTRGVYAAHAPGARLDARPAGTGNEDGWVLDGTKPWCSLAADLSHAIITAHTGPTSRRAFAIALTDGVSPLDGAWVARGLVDVPSGGLRLDGVPAVAVGNDEWYLSRPGFAWGGIGVAAVWFGAAHALRATLVDSLRRREPDQIALMHVGHLDTVLHAAELSLRHAAVAIDGGAAEGGAGAVLAARVRAVVAHAAETCLTVLGHALGPGPLTADEVHARRVADLTVYVRQHHAERDLAALGSAVLALPDEGSGSSA